ncbi:hypothetical protein EPO34_00935 [Patescibacteria group bacterium]|nr:MAG: hypothetical protein EPO34_00935 [Patescibacteria group bacterium]
MAFDALKDLLPGAMNRGHIAEQVAIARALEGANRAIAAALPAGRDGDARALSLRDGVVMIACLNAPAMRLISRIERDVVAGALKEAPKSDIHGIRVRLVQRISASGDMIG